MRKEISKLYNLRQWQRCLDILLDLNKRGAEELNLIGACYKNLGDEASAENYFIEAKDKYSYEKSIFNLGLLYQDQGRSEALGLFEEAVRLRPENSNFLVQLGVSYERENKLIESYSTLLAAVLMNPLDPLVVGAYVGSCRKNGKRHAAIEVLERYLENEPEDETILSLYATELELNGNIIDTLKIYKRISLLKPERLFPLLAIAKILFNRNLHTEVVKILKHALTLEEAEDIQRRSSIQESLFINLQRAFEEEEARLVYEELNKHQDAQVANPFAYICFEDDSELQLKRAKCHAERYSGYKSSHAFSSNKTSSGKRIKVGYIGGDFYNHAMMHLMSGVFREHNSEKFEIHCFSLNEKRDSRTLYIENTVENYHELSALNFDQRLEFIREKRLDIALDIGGYTKDTAPSLFSARVAEKQVNFLGYPATMGLENMDFILGDSWVTPLDKQEYFSEKIVQMPSCYQPNDDRRTKLVDELSRKDCGLPEDTFVFGCFNQTYKIRLQDVKLWSRILAKAPNSVLWLLTGVSKARDNIIAEFCQRGIDRNRIIFADRMKLEQHLSRHQYMDLFLDTSIYNAHTTGSDALWYGVPIVTNPGNTFASRVGASLLDSVNLPEFICSDDKQYEELALEFYRNTEFRQNVKRKLGQFDDSLPLFNTSKWVEDYEGVLKKIVDR